MNQDRRPGSECVDAEAARVGQGPKGSEGDTWSWKGRKPGKEGTEGRKEGRKGKDGKREEEEDRTDRNAVETSSGKKAEADRGVERRERR